MVRYKMVGRDVNSVPTQYRTWVVENTPDLTGALYTGPKSGSNPLVDISAYAIFDDTAVVDFNLPVPTQWQTPSSTPFDFYGRQVLPDQVSDGALAIIDGYIYIFGGNGTDAIFISSIADPGTWVNTGATLPTILYNSSLAIVDGYIYLFGGNTGTSANSRQPVATIYVAPVSNPLQWSNSGSSLPGAVHSSSLGMANGYLFLAGGWGTSGAINSIYTASTSNPLIWTIAGSLPTPLYGTTIMQTAGYWYLLGGQTTLNQIISTIFRASISSPFSWSSYGSMPYPTSYGAFFPMGNDGYYIGSAVNDGYDTTTFTPILQVSLASMARWIDTQQVVPAVLSHSQTAIVADRFWFFAGSGLTALFTNAQTLKYPICSPAVVAYGYTTRTLFQASDNLDNPFLVLTIPYWLTDYQM